MTNKPARNALSIAHAGGEISTGVVHQVPDDLRKTLVSDSLALEKWEDITPLARNEWICWVISVKKRN